jgi:hypothetical protein
MHPRSLTVHTPRLRNFRIKEKSRQPFPPIIRRNVRIAAQIQGGSRHHQRKALGARFWCAIISHRYWVSVLSAPSSQRRFRPAPPNAVSDPRHLVYHSRGFNTSLCKADSHHTASDSQATSFAISPFTGLTGRLSRLPETPSNARLRNSLAQRSSRRQSDLRCPAIRCAVVRRTGRNRECSRVREILQPFT